MSKEIQFEDVDVSEIDELIKNGEIVWLEGLHTPKDKEKGDAKDTTPS